MFDWMCMLVQGGQRPVFWLLVFTFGPAETIFGTTIIYFLLTCSMNPLLIHVITKLLLLLSLILKA